VANVIAIIGLAGRYSGEATVEDLWRDLVGDPGPPPEGADRLFRECAADLLQGLAYEDRTGLFIRGAEGDGLVAAVADPLGLCGPAVTVHGPALAAVERACQSLLSNECDLALAGEAPVRGDGAVVVALKRLPAALADGDSILAVIHGPAARALAAPPTVPQVRRDPAETGEPGPLRERPALANPYTPPANPLEAAIASIWQEELGIDRVGVDDNFFELGGTSIAGVKIIALLKEWLRQDIPTVSLYEGPTVSALAKVLLHSGPPKGYDSVRERGERRRRKLQRLGHGPRQEAAEGEGEDHGHGSPSDQP
jgi:acyl carrier protein